jgi:hypothetical protein
MRLLANARCQPLNRSSTLSDVVGLNRDPLARRAAGQQYGDD